jgi:hypothetical protein
MIDKTVRKLLDQKKAADAHNPTKKLPHDYVREHAKHGKSGMSGGNVDSSLGPVSSAPFERRKVADELQHGKMHLESPGQPPDVPEMLGNLQLAITTNLIYMKEVVNNIKKKGSIDERAIRKLHSRIFGSRIGCGAFYYSFRNNIPFLDSKERETAAKNFFAPFKDFQKALKSCAEELDKLDIPDNPFPWKSGKYEDSEAQLYGIEPRSKPEANQKRDLSLDEQKKIEHSYEAVSEAAKALNDYLGISVDKWKEAVELSRKRQEIEKPRSKL